MISAVYRFTGPKALGILQLRDGMSLSVVSCNWVCKARTVVHQVVCILFKYILLTFYLLLVLHIYLINVCYSYINYTYSTSESLPYTRYILFPYQNHSFKLLG